LKSFKTNEKGYLEGLINNEYPFMPRQELPKVYQPNGAIYIIDVDAFSKNGSFFTDRTVAFEMSKKKSIDIDSMADIQKVETYVNS
jgi:CMP-N-acetylneuraminic acid synthetase